MENDSIGSHDRSKDRESHNVCSSSSRASVSAHGSMSVSVSGAASSSSRRSTSVSASVSVSSDSHTSRSRASHSLEVRDNDSATDIDREGEKEKERERKGYDGSSFSPRASGGGSGSGRMSVSSSKSASAAIQPSSSVSVSPDNQTAVSYTDIHKSRDKDSDRERESESGDEGDRYDATSSSSVASMSMSGRMSATSTRSGTGYGSSSVSMSGFTSMSPGTHIPDSHVPEIYRGGGGGDTVVSNDRYDGSSSSARGSAREHTNVLVSGTGPRSTSLSNCGHASPDSHAKRSHNDSHQGSGMGGREKMVERDRGSDSDVETERGAQREIERERDTGGYDGSSSSSSRSSSHQTRASMLASVSRTASRAVSASSSSSVAPDSIASGSHITDQYRDRDGGRDRETERYHYSSSSSLASSKTHKSIPASSSDSRVGSVSVSASQSIGSQALGLRVKDEDEERGSDGERGAGSDRESSSQSSRSSTGGRTSGPPLASGVVSRPSSSQRSTSASASVSPSNHTVRSRTSDGYEVRDSVWATDRGREWEMEGQEGSISSSRAGDSQHASSQVSASGSVLRSRSHSRPTSRSASVSVSRDNHALGSRVADGYKGKDEGSDRESRSDRERGIDRDRKGEQERGRERDREGYDSSSSSSTAGGSASVSTSSRRGVPVQRTGPKSVSVTDSASMSPESQRSQLHVTGRHEGRNSDRDGDTESGRDSVGVRHQGSSANPLSAIYHDDSPCVSAPASPPSSQTRSQSQSSSSGSEGESSRHEGRNSDTNRDGDKESGSNKDTVGHPRISPTPRSTVKPRSGSQSTSASSQSTSPDREDEGEEGEDESFNSASMRSRISEADRGLAIRLENSNGPSTRPSLSRLLRIKVQDPWSPPHTPPEMDVKVHPPVELHGLLVRAKRRVDVLDDWMGEESSAWDVAINMDSIHEEHRVAVTIVSGTLYDHEDKEGILGPTPSALIHGRSMERMDSIANGKPSMKVLKALVEDALHDLAIMRRNEVLSWECNDALRISAKAIRTSVVTLADNGLERLREYRERVVALRADRDSAVHWSELVQSTLDKVEVRYGG